MLKKINLTAGILLRTYFINPTPLSLNGIKATSLFLFHVYPLPIFVNASLWEMSGVERHYFVDTIPWKIYDRPLCFFLKNIGSQCLALNLWRKWFRERKVSQLSLRGRCVMAHHTSSMEDLCAPYFFHRGSVRTIQLSLSWLKLHFGIPWWFFKIPVLCAPSSPWKSLIWFASRKPWFWRNISVERCLLHRICFYKLGQKSSFKKFI
jgi:hypothetical protein